MWNQIDTRLHLRAAKADQISSFAHTLEPGQSAQARNILKDPYNFDFLRLSEDLHEREIETALIRHMRQFLMELGVGFVFAGSQYRLVVGGDVDEQLKHPIGIAEYRLARPMPDELAASLSSPAVLEAELRAIAHENASPPPPAKKKTSSSRALPPAR